MPHHAYSSLQSRQLDSLCDLHSSAVASTASYAYAGGQSDNNDASRSERETALFIATGTVRHTFSCCRNPGFGLTHLQMTGGLSPRHIAAS